jgi:hypothetical protein
MTVPGLVAIVAVAVALSAALCWLIVSIAARRARSRRVPTAAARRPRPGVG